MVQVNDLIPAASGSASLGIDSAGSSIAGQTAFDIATLNPFLHIHSVSGIYHDALHGASGVIRFNKNLDCFEVSNNGGVSFDCLVTTSTAGGVATLGATNGTALTGAVTLDAPVSGLLIIDDTGGASPITFSLDVPGLSGLFDFPTQGFNGSIVNDITDDNGTTVNGSLTFTGASGVVVDALPDGTVTFSLGNQVPRCYTETFAGALTTWTVTHNLNTSEVIVMTYDTANMWFLADKMETTDVNTVTIAHNVAQAGRVIVIGC